MIKLFWNTQNQIKPTSDDPNREDVFDYRWGEYHKDYSDKWIFFLLNNIKYKTVKKLDEIEQNDILIIIDSSIEKKKAFYVKLRLICSKIFLFHLGDEAGIVDHSQIYDDCEYVWRFFCTNKYFKKKNLSCLPIGYKSGISLTNKKSNNKYKWNFIGTPHKSSRHDLLFQLSEIKPSFIFKTKKFNDKKILRADQMSEVLSSTTFVPCPNGFVHPETYRLYEALECNSIPIIESSFKYYDRLFPNNPLLKIDKWLDAKKIIAYWDNEQIDKKKKESQIWWTECKAKLQDFITKRIVQ